MKYYRLLILIICSVLCVSCEKDNSEDTDDNSANIHINQTEFTLSSDSQSFQVEVKSNKEYHITIGEECKDWINLAEIKHHSTDNVVFKVNNNLNYDDRVGTISFSLEDGYTTQLSITQLKKDAIFTYVPLNNSISYKEQTFEIKILSNTQVEIHIDSDWITLEDTRGLSETSFFLKIAENSSFNKRTSKVLLKGETIQDSICFSQQPHPIDLSSNGTANCYIVPPTGSLYSFNAMVGGNDMNYHLVGGTKAGIVWEAKEGLSDNQLIEEIEYDPERGLIYFQANEEEGNVLIALLDEYDNILWSWHLWLTHYDPEEQFITFNTGAVLMDRNLGAFSQMSSGIQYQWGRKDPFIKGHYSTTFPDEITGTIGYTIQHPTICFNNNYAVTCWDWNKEHTATWSSSKTVFDPCPPGWKVMDSNAMPSWSYGNGAVVGEGHAIIEEPICHPTTKYRFGPNWTNLGYFNMFYCAKVLKISDIGPRWEVEGRAYTNYVRCQRE